MKQTSKNWRSAVSKIEKVLKELSDLRDFYNRVKNRNGQQLRSAKPGSGS
jgi:hypothetical protein